MAKHKDIEFGQNLFQSLLQITDTPDKNQHLAARLQTTESGELRKMKKFRFQLLHQWLTTHFKPCRVADVAGGKGLLVYLLQKNGWKGVVIDPVNQALPTKYKNIITNKQTKITPAESVPRIDRIFDPAMARNFDLLIGMHAHGCNVQIVDVAAELGRGFVLFPCCVMDEPFFPPLGVNWLETVADYAVKKGQPVYPFRLNFKGQNIGLCSPGQLQPKL